MYRSLQSDLKYGFQKEKEIIDIINNYFNDNVIKLKHNNKYDFQGNNNTFYELKSRRNNYKAFSTTLIGSSKITNNNIVFLFNFTDGLYYIKYDQEIFNNFEKKPFKRRPRVGYIDKEEEYVYIPIESLTKII